ncbi:hypothetical protein M9458_017150, partial [Cirrhinus mrigala]
KLILIKENLTWSEALRYCRQNHVDLIQHRVMNVVRRASTVAVWLGLHNYCIINISCAIRTGLQGTEQHRKTANSKREKEQFSLEEISAGSAFLKLTNSTSSAAD